jgi:hypothetical protein
VATPLGRSVVELRGLGPVDLRGGGQCLCVERGYVGLGILGLLEPEHAEACMRMQGVSYFYIGQPRVSDILHIPAPKTGVSASLLLSI